MTPQDHRAATVAIHCGEWPVVHGCGASPAAEETGMRRAGTFARWHRSRTIPSVLALCTTLSGAALAADTEGATIEGRWETARKDLVLDISRCAQGYCGRVVTPDNKCERTTLTVSVRTDEPPYPVFAGDFAPPKAGRPNYRVRISVTLPGEKPVRMSIIGDEVDPDPIRRSFPYRAMLTRVGDAACSSRTTS